MKNIKIGTILRNAQGIERKVVSVDKYFIVLDNGEWLSPFCLNFETIINH